jgi:pyruvate/2-oxoglutarate dehydrogenase complex dihydrolipoamide dehydrogenase (E3) component
MGINPETATSALNRNQAADPHEIRRLRNVRPPDWRNPTPGGRYNLVAVGAGTAGLVSAAGAAGLGAKVALVERHHLGGDCLNVGCVPSKALIRAARAAAAVRSAAAFGVRLPDDVPFDFSAAMERMRRLRADISPGDSADRFRSLGVDVYFGQATFTGANSLSVDGQTIHFKRAVIATGARASIPPIPGLADAGCLTNETVFSLMALPRRLAVIGAGPIGCELAQAFARFGSQVFLLDIAPAILPAEVPDAADIIAQSLRRDGIQILCGATDLRVDVAAGKKRLTGKTLDRTLDIEVDEILVGAGRTPNTDGLGLDAAGVQYDRTGVIVDDRLRTSNRRIYAAGDICSRYKFTHAADAMARIAVQNALFLGRVRVSRLTIPWCTYTDPELAHVGMYEHEAHQRGIPTTALEQTFQHVDRALLDGESEGFIRVLLRRGTDRILGATIVADHAGDLISSIGLAMTNGLGLKSVAKTVFPYPTQAECIKKLADVYNRTRLTPRIHSLMKKWLAWTR